jgi:O-succinylbenzoic acid--CoA ligase
MIHRAGVVGCTLVTRPRFDAGELADLIDGSEVTHASLVPVMLRRLIDARGSRPAPPSLRCLLVGGAATPAALLDRALELGYPISLTYGMTETTSQVATATPDEVRGKPGSVGKPLSGVEVEIDPPIVGGSGTIRVRGPTLAPGSSLTETGWLDTGDLGHFDADGDLWVTGRASDRIVTGGVRVEPIEVEAVLEAHPSAREVAVVGVPDVEWGERIVAVVVPEDSERPPTLEGLLEFSRSRLASSKRPRSLTIVSELPRTTNGKLDRARLRGLSS